MQPSFSSVDLTEKEERSLQNSTSHIQQLLRQKCREFSPSQDRKNGKIFRVTTLRYRIGTHPIRISFRTPICQMLWKRGRATIGGNKISRKIIRRRQLGATTIRHYANWSLRELVAWHQHELIVNFHYLMAFPEESRKWKLVSDE